MSAGERWRAELLAWEIPAEILAQAPESPWFIPPSVLSGAGRTATVSQQWALEALPPGGTVLDVGAGTGAMSAPLRTRAGRIVAVDTDAERLAACDADVRVTGAWPDVAAEAGAADVVVCGHVLYNVPDLAPFVDALGAAAQRRVVIEMTARHPRALETERALWRHFWSLDRPTGPTWDMAEAVLRERGVRAVVEHWRSGRRAVFPTFDELVAATRRRVCLAGDRDGELAHILRGLAVQTGAGWGLGEPEVPLVTLWWDV